MIRRLSFGVWAALSWFIGGGLVACGGGGSAIPPNGGNGGPPPTATPHSTSTPHATPTPTMSPTPTPSPTPTASPTAAPQNVYVANGSSSGAVLAFQLPITATSKPVLSLPAGNTPLGIAFDPANRLFVLSDLNIFVFAQPITNNASPTIDLTTNTDGQSIAFDSKGNAYVTRCSFDIHGNCNSVVDVYDPDFLLSPSFSIAVGPSTRAYGLAFDRTGNLWIGVTPDALNGTIHDEVVEYTPPFTASSKAVLSFNTAPIARSGGLAFDASGNMYLNGPDSVDVYKPPFSVSTSRAFGITTTPSNSFDGHVAFDLQGRMYVSANNGVVPGQLLVFNPPLTAASVTSVVLSIPPAEATGVAVGP